MRLSEMQFIYNLTRRFNKGVYSLHEYKPEIKNDD